MRRIAAVRDEQMDKVESKRSLPTFIVKLDIAKKNAKHKKT